MWKRYISVVLFFSMIVFKSTDVFGSGGVLIPIEKDGLWGYSDHEGKIVIEPQWAQVYNFINNTALVSLKTDIGNIDKGWYYKDGLINSLGEYILPPIYNIHRHDYVYYVQEEINQLWGYYDIDSGFFRSPQYENILDGFPYYLKPQKSGYIAVKENGKWGFIERITGEVILPFVYDDVLSNHNNGYALVIRRTETTSTLTEQTVYLYDSEDFILIDERGELFELDEGVHPVSGITNNGSFVAKMKITSVNGEKKTEVKYGLISTSKEVIVPFIYYDIKLVSENKALFCISENYDMWGMMDNKGNILIEAKYTSLYDVPGN